MKIELNFSEVGVVSGGIEGDISCRCDVKYWGAAVNFVGYAGMVALPIAIVIKPFGWSAKKNNFTIFGVSASFGLVITICALFGN